MKFINLLFIIFGLSVCNFVSAQAATNLAGGYHSISVQSPEVMAAAEFAAQQINKGKLVTIVEAQSQVVAGINYSLILEIADEDTVINIYSATVFVPLPVTQEAMQLTAWQQLSVNE